MQQSSATPKNQDVGIGLQNTPKGIRLLHRVSKLFYSTLGVLVNTSQELVNGITEHWCLRLVVLFNTQF